MPRAGGPLAAGAAMLNPLRSEAEAFRFLIYVVVIMATIAGAVLAGRAIF